MSYRYPHIHEYTDWSHVARVTAWCAPYCLFDGSSWRATDYRTILASCAITASSPTTTLMARRSVISRLINIQTIRIFCQNHLRHLQTTLMSYRSLFIIFFFSSKKLSWFFFKDFCLRLHLGKFHTCVQILLLCIHLLLFIRFFFVFDRDINFIILSLALCRSGFIASAFLYISSASANLFHRWYKTPE